MATVFTLDANETPNAKRVFENATSMLASLAGTAIATSDNLVTLSGTQDKYVASVTKLHSAGLKAKQIFKTNEQGVLEYKEAVITANGAVIESEKKKNAALLTEQQRAADRTKEMQKRAWAALNAQRPEVMQYGTHGDSRLPQHVMGQVGGIVTPSAKITQLREEAKSTQSELLAISAVIQSKTQALAATQKAWGQAMRKAPEKSSVAEKARKQVADILAERDGAKEELRVLSAKWLTQASPKRKADTEAQILRLQDMVKQGIQQERMLRSVAAKEEAAMKEAKAKGLAVLKEDLETKRHQLALAHERKESLETRRNLAQAAIQEQWKSDLESARAAHRAKIAKQELNLTKEQAAQLALIQNQTAAKAAGIAGNRDKVELARSTGDYSALTPSEVRLASTYDKGDSQSHALIAKWQKDVYKQAGLAAARNIYSQLKQSEPISRALLRTDVAGNTKAAIGKAFSDIQKEVVALSAEFGEETGRVVMDEYSRAMAGEAANSPATERLNSLITKMKATAETGIKAANAAINEAAKKAQKGQDDFKKKMDKNAKAAFEQNLRKDMESLSKGLDFTGLKGEQIVKIRGRIMDLIPAMTKAGKSAADFQRIWKLLEETRGPNSAQAIKALENLAGSDIGIAKSISGIRTDMDRMVVGLDKGDVIAQKIRRSVVNWGTGMRLFVIQGLHTAIAQTIQVLKGAMKHFMDFEIRISEIRTISQEAQLSTDRWADGVRRLSATFGLDIMDTAAGTYEAISNQIAKGADAFIFMAEAAKFSIATVSTSMDGVNLLSSAINSYGFNVSMAREISATLFTTIELGRVRANEMANTLGLLTQTASSLGVTFTDLNNAVATMTIQGIKYDNAATLIRNVMQKLLRPTDEMKKLFKEWGVESGEAAIRTFGFAGILRKFAQIARVEGVDAIGELFGRMRGIQGIIALASTGFNQFIKNQDAFDSQAIPKYTKALEYSFESVGRRIQIETNKIKQFVTVDLGKSLADMAVGFTDAFRFITDGSVLNAFKMLIVTVPTLAAGFFLLRFNMKAVRDESIILTAVNQGLAASTMSAGAGIGALWKSLFTLPNVLTVVALAIGGLVMYIGRLGTSIEDLRRRIDEDLTKSMDFFIDGVTRRRQAFERHLEGIARFYGQALAKIRAHNSGLATAMKEDIPNAMRNLKNAMSNVASDFESKVASMRNQVDELRKSAEKLNTSVVGHKERQFENIRALAEDSLKNRMAQAPGREAEILAERMKHYMAVIRKTLAVKDPNDPEKNLIDKAIFERQMDDLRRFLDFAESAYSKTSEKLNAAKEKMAALDAKRDESEESRKKRILDLEAQRAKLLVPFNKADPGREAKRKIDLESVNRKIAEARSEPKTIAAQQSALGKEIKGYETAIANFKARQMDLESIERKRIQLIKAENAAREIAIKRDEAMADKKTAEADALQKAADAQKIAIEGFQAKLNELYTADFKPEEMKLPDATPFTKDGVIQDAAYMAEVKKKFGVDFLANFDKQVKEIFDAAAKIDIGGGKTGAEWVQTRSKRIEEMRKSFEDRIDKEREIQTQDYYAKQLKVLEEAKQRGEDAQSKYAEAQARLNTAAATIASTLQKGAEQLKGDASGTNFFVRPFSMAAAGLTGGAIGTDTNQQIAAGSALNFLKAMQKQTLGMTPEQALAQVVKHSDYYLKLFDETLGHLSKAGLGETKMVDGKLVSQTASKIFTQVQASRTALIQSVKDKQSMDTAKADLRNFEKFKADFQKTMNWQAVQTEATKDLTTTLRDANKLIMILNQRLEPFKPKTDGDAGEVQITVPTIKRARGGFVPSGTDTVPAMLTPGEFVVNREASRRFAPLLHNLNSGRGVIPNQTTYDVGPINITVVTDKPTKQTAMELGQELRRLVNNGVLTLGRS
jgi:TP901 family phage tail tape measure protein